MDFYEVIKTRRSVRSYRDKEVDEATLNKILEAGRLAPSANNSQDYKFVVVKDKDKRKALSKAASGQKFVAEAPIIIAAVSLKPDYLMDSGVPSYAVDLAIAFDHITLAAASEGLGTCWIGSFSQEEAKNILEVSEQYKIAALLTLGTPYDEPGVKSRKTLKDLVRYEIFSE